MIAYALWTSPARPEGALENMEGGEGGRGSPDHAYSVVFSLPAYTLM